MIKLLIILMTIFFLSPIVYSADKTKHLTMEEIVVTEEVLVDSSLIVLGTKTIEKGKNLSIPDVLKYEAEIDISRRALVGDTGDILSIRGLSGNRIMLNIDGRSINAAGVQGGYFIDWSTIPLDNIEKIEIMKGGSSVKYGNNAGGGVINVITKKPTEKPTFSFYGNYGFGEDYYDVQNYRLTHTYKIGPFGYSIGGSYQRADEFLWNNDYEAKNLSTKLYFDMPLKGEMTFGVQYTLVERGFAINNRLSTNPNNSNFYKPRNYDYPLSFGETFSPYRGNVTEPGPGAMWEKTKYLLDFSYKQPIGSSVLELKAYKNFEDRDEKNYSASWLNSTYPDGKLVLDRTVKSDRSYGGSIEFTMPMKDHEVIGGVERKVIKTGGQDVRYVDNSYGVTGGPIAPSSGIASYMWGFYLTDNWSLTDRLLLTPGIRYDTYKAPQTGLARELEIKEEGLSMSLAGTFNITKSDIITLAIYKKYITPSAPDAWWWYEGFIGGLYTTTLKLESNNALELTYKHNFSDRDYIRLALYRYYIDDFIRRFTIPTGRGCYNIDRVILTGATFDGAFEATKGLTLIGNITYQSSKKEGDIYDPAKLTDELDYTPQWKFNLGADIKLPFNSLLSLRSKYVGERITVYSYRLLGQTRYKLIELGSFITADAELKIPFAKNAELGLYAENLFDKKYEERFGYPMAGRIIGAAVKLTF